MTSPVTETNRAFSCSAIVSPGGIEIEEGLKHLLDLLLVGVDDAHRLGHAEKRVLVCDRGPQRAIPTVLEQRVWRCSPCGESQQRRSRWLIDMAFVPGHRVLFDEIEQLGRLLGIDSGLGQPIPI